MHLEVSAPTHIMEFSAPEFHPGLNVTVRNGTQWAGMLKPGGYIELAGTDGVDYGCAIVAAVERVSAVESPQDLARWLPFEHALDCRTYEGLAIALDRAYPDGWGPDLTVVAFVPLLEE